MEELIFGNSNPNSWQMMIIISLIKNFKKASYIFFL